MKKQKQKYYTAHEAYLELKLSALEFLKESDDLQEEVREVVRSHYATYNDFIDFLKHPDQSLLNSKKEAKDWALKAKYCINVFVIGGGTTEIKNEVLFKRKGIKYLHNQILKLA